MSAIFLHSIRTAGEAGELVILDDARRLYAGLNRDATSWHVIQPARADDPRVNDNLREAGQLVCTCAGGTFRGTCYRTVQAERFEGEAEDREAMPAIFRQEPVLGLDNPAGAGEMVEASRG